MSIDIGQLMDDIKTAASQVVEKDITTMRGFSERQLKALAKQTSLIAEGIRSGDIDEDLRDFFLDSLEDMALNFVKTLRGMLAVTIEKTWNAVVGVIWRAIESVTNIALPLPS